MISEVVELRARLKEILLEYLGSLKVRIDKASNFEICGTIKAKQGAKVVDGIYFASLVPKHKDVRFYFYPAYSHSDQFDNLSQTLTMFKKGKSCFHVKFLNEELETELKEMISKGILLYQKDGLLQ